MTKPFNAPGANYLILEVCMYVTLHALFFIVIYGKICLVKFVRLNSIFIENVFDKNCDLKNIFGFFIRMVYDLKYIVSYHRSNRCSGSYLAT